jgi:hypothetical protein
MQTVSSENMCSQSWIHRMNNGFEFPLFLQPNSPSAPPEVEILKFVAEIQPTASLI